jgi:6-phosphofructokinase 1
MTQDLFTVDTLGHAKIPNPRLESATQAQNGEERILYNPYLSSLNAVSSMNTQPDSFELAGPRSQIYFSPSHTKAAIVTCGGLCPGINSVIRALVHQLWHRYDVRNIVGIRYGYQGLSPLSKDEPIPLSPEKVMDIESGGGSFLGSSRGAPEVTDIVDTLQKLNINQLYPIGGDGTMRGAWHIYEEIQKRGLKIAVVGIPKTIDNDIPYVRRSFGFETAVTISAAVLTAAHAEAKGTRNGIGLVKLMGRHSGYVTANATLATGLPNFCFIPEVPFQLDGPGGLFELLEKRFQKSDHVLIAVAEGAGQHFFSASNEKDASGNVKFHDIGIYLKDRLSQHFKAKNFETSVKYIDPSYMIRAAPATPPDALFCAKLAQDAVHGAMAGKTGIIVGYWHGQNTYVPIKALLGNSQRIKPSGKLWFNVLETTGQPAVIGTP